MIAVYRRSFATAIGAGLIGTAATVAVPKVLGDGLNAVARDESATPFVVALLVLAVVRFVFGFAYRFGLFSSALRIENDLRNLMYERLTLLSFEFWDRTQSGQVISRANSDIRSIQLLFAFGPLVAMQVVLFFFALVVMMSVDPLLTVVAVAPLPLVYLTGARLRDRVFPLQWLVTARQADLATIVDESIQGLRVVKAFNQEANQIQRLASSARRLRWASTEVVDTRARHAPGMESLPRLGLALVLLVGGLQVLDNELAVGDLVAFSAYVLLLATPFRLMGFILIQWQRAGAAALRVFDILDEEPTITDPADPIPLPHPRGSVAFDNVTFAYPTGDGEPVISGFSATIEPGETVAIVGATGSGKSTLSRLLTRFYDVDGGTVRLDGHDVRQLRLTDLRKAVAAVTDDPFLFAESIDDNVAFARPDAPATDIARALADAAAEPFVDHLAQGRATVVGERGFTLSGGQRQRLALARTLLADPAVLVLDDATSAIDVEVEEEIHRRLAARRQGRTTILIAHRLSTIALADRVILIDGGQAIATGSHDELLASNPRYAAILADATVEPDATGEEVD